MRVPRPHKIPVMRISVLFTEWLRSSTFTLPYWITSAVIYTFKNFIRIILSHLSWYIRWQFQTFFSKTSKNATDVKIQIVIIVYFNKCLTADTSVLKTSVRRGAGLAFEPYWKAPQSDDRSTISCHAPFFSSL